VTPEQIEIERKSFEARSAVEWPDANEIARTLAWVGWLARAEKAQRVREALDYNAEKARRMREALERIIEVLDRGNVVPSASDLHKAARAALKD
jgi:hypothetical protein